MLSSLQNWHQTVGTPHTIWGIYEQHAMGIHREVTCARIKHDTKKRFFSPHSNYCCQHYYSLTLCIQAMVTCSCRFLLYHIYCVYICDLSGISLLFSKHLFFSLAMLCCLQHPSYKVFLKLFSSTTFFRMLQYVFYHSLNVNSNGLL